MSIDNFTTFRVAACDLNGQMRGKRMPASYFANLENERRAHASFGAERRYQGCRH